MLKLIAPFFSFLLLIAFTAKGEEKGDPPSVMPGLEIKRSYLINQMQAADSSLVFKQGPGIKGEKSLIGTDKDGSSLEFLGDEDNLKKAAFTFKFTTDHQINLLQYQRMAYFAFLMAGKNGVNWLEEWSAEFIKDKTKSIKNSKNFDYNRKGTYVYDPLNKAITLVFTEW